MKPTVEASASPTSEPIDIPMGKVTAVRLADMKSGWAGGEGWIARTDSGGDKWQVQYKSTGTIQQLFALNGQDAWAALEDASLLSTSDGGKQWTIAGKVPNKGFFHFVSKQEAFSGNARTTDGGKSWTTLLVPEHIVGDAYFHDKDNGWAITQVSDKLEVKRTQDGGHSWTSVLTKTTLEPVSGTLIRSAGRDDAWIELIGGSGMSQTSYSLFHTTDGGKQWQTVIANSTAGAGPAPGFPLGYMDGPTNKGSKPGALYVVSPQVAFMGGQCPACDEPNTIGWTIDGGKTWVNGKESFKGNGEQLIAMVDAKHGWWINTDHTEPSEMFTTSDGGNHWKKVHTFERPKSGS
ncbi:Ycf48-like protein [compost metagenome]